MAKIALSWEVLKTQNIFFCSLKLTSLSGFLPWCKRAFNNNIAWLLNICALSKTSRNNLYEQMKVLKKL
jgi:hypothetical protein